MSGAQDTKSVYPDKQASITSFESTYKLYRQRIRTYFSVKLNPMAADDLTQQVFLKAVENLHNFRAGSNVFTWIFKIAQNTLKNEYRRLSRKKKLHSILRLSNHNRSPLNLRNMLIFGLILEPRLKHVMSSTKKSLHYAFLWTARCLKSPRSLACVKAR